MAVAERSFWLVEFMRDMRLTMIVSILCNSRRFDIYLVVFYPDTIFLSAMRTLMLLCNAGIWNGFRVRLVLPTWNIHISSFTWR